MLNSHEGLPEYDAKDISPTILRQAILARGTILIRNLIPQEVIRPLGDDVLKMIAHFDSIPQDIVRREMGYEEPARKNMWREILNDGVHYNYDLITFTAGRASMFDPLHKSAMFSLVRDAFPEARIEENFITNTRRIFPKPPKGGYSDVPLEPHIDAMFHQHDVFGINFWTPLTEAGEHAPGLAVVPNSVVDVRNAFEYNPEGYEVGPHDFAHMHRFKSHKVAPEGLEQLGYAHRFVRPKMQPGDVLAFTNFTVHATSVLPGMTNSRTSIEVRVLLREDTQKSRFIHPEDFGIVPISVEGARGGAQSAANMAANEARAPAPATPRPPRAEGAPLKLRIR